jgi:hypothetical protein
MKAAVRERYGPPEVVEVREVATPTPKDDEVLVRVRAASINRADLDYLGPRPGFIRPIVGMRAPRDPRMGIDVAGVVEAVGPSVTGFQAGDRVYADLLAFGAGAFAEFVCAPARAFATIPPGLSFEDAATLPHSAILAIQGLRRRNGRTVRPGDRVLIDGASGNVGPFAVQIAKTLGAEVTGVGAAPALLDLQDPGVVGAHLGQLQGRHPCVDAVVDDDQLEQVLGVGLSGQPGEHEGQRAMGAIGRHHDADVEVRLPGPEGRHEQGTPLVAAYPRLRARHSSTRLS